VRGVIFGASRTSYPNLEPTDHAQKPHKCQIQLYQHFRMALRLGVGDVFTVCKGAVDFCRAIHDEPEEVQSVIAEMKLIRAHLKSLESQIGDEKAFATARPDM
jgi:predicted peroxiredoxin